MLRRSLLYLYNLYAWLLFVPAVILALVTSRLLLLFVKKDREHLYFKTVGGFGAVWGWLVGIRFFVARENKGKLEKGKSYVVVANHISFLDIHAIAIGMPVGFLALSKIENKKLPLFGPLISPGIITVDRSSPNSRHESFEAMAKVVERGISVLVFPEGSRNKKLDQPLRDKFYDGAFRIAIQHQIPIAPMIITGNRRCMPPGTLLFKPGPVGIYLLDPIPTEGMTEADMGTLKAQAYEAMAEKLRKEDPWLKGTRIEGVKD
jgi:1-acyl-sn-glycerol-3-phosphate acyltransferase